MRRRLKILIAPNALKGSLDAFAAAHAIAAGLAQAMPDAELALLPVADGGDGTARVLVHGCGGKMVEARVRGPLGQEVLACFGLLDENTEEGVRTAVVEVAAAAGLALLPPDQRDPLITSSYGAGELIGSALDRNCGRIVVGLGGSATVDGGAGLVEALGVRLLDDQGRSIARGGAGLAFLDRIDVTGRDPRLASTEILVVCDVDNPLLGERGAARVFGPQKGASPPAVERLEANLSRFAEVIARDLGKDVRFLEHGGAAGGMAAGIAGILGGKLVEGASLLLDLLHFDEHLAGADLVMTAEGLLDEQTLGHKAPWGVASRARRRGVPVIVLAGGITDEVTSARFPMFDAIVPICPRPMPLDEAMGKASECLRVTAEQVGRIFCLGHAKGQAQD
jgi:glycerate kinase